jgi:hypothetical protein
MGLMRNRHPEGGGAMRKLRSAPAARMLHEFAPD